MFRISLLIAVLITSITAQNLNETNITIPWSDFRTVLKELHKDTIRERTIPEIPAAYVISDAEYSGKMISEDEFTFNSKLEITVIEDRQWIEIDLGRGTALYPGITVDGKPAKVGLRKDGTTFLMIRGAGIHTVSYRFLVARSEASGLSSISFPMPGQAVARLNLLLDSDQYQVFANERPLIVSKAGNALYRYSGGLGTGKRTYIRWKQEMSRGNGQEALVSGRLNTIYSIGMGVIQMQSQINLSVLHREIRKFSFTVPKELDIIDLTGQAVATWEAKDSGDIRHVTAYLKYSITDNAPFLLKAELSYPDTLTAISLPELTLDGTSRQEGIIGVGVLSNVELKQDQLSNNVLQRDKRELPTWFSDQGDVLFVYQHLSGGYDISLKLTHHENLPVLDALVRRGSISSVIRDDGKMITRYDMEVHNRGEQFLRCDWDSTWQLWSVYCNGKPARPAYDSLTGQLLVPLDKSSDHTRITKVRLVYLSSQNKFSLWGKQSLSYPKLNMPLQEISGALYVPDGITKYRWNGSLMEANYFTPASNFMQEYRSTKDEYLSNTSIDAVLQSAGSSKMDNNLGLEPSQSSQSSQGEAGLLSIPVNIEFKGKALPFKKLIGKPAEELQLTFDYYTLPVPRPTWLRKLITLLTVLAGALFAYALYKGLSLRRIVTIAVPTLIGFGLAKLFNLQFDIWNIFLIPMVSLIIILFKRAIEGIVGFINNRRKRHLEQEDFFESSDEESSDDIDYENENDDISYTDNTDEEDSYEE